MGNRLVAMTAFVVALLLAPYASADAIVRVQVRGVDGELVATDGNVTLNPLGDGKSFRCRTQRGTCSIMKVPGGRYMVAFSSSKQSSNPKKVMIPPDGEVQLRISVK